MSTIITASQLKDSYFADMPDFPSVNGAIGSNANPTLPTRANGSINLDQLRTPPPNKIYFNRRMHVSDTKRVDPNMLDEIIERVWQIPFTVDTNLPVSEITERIDKAMDKLGLYTYWKINYNGYNITAYEKIKFELK